MPSRITATRIAIPALRFLSWYKALWILGYPHHIVYAPPFQKLFVVPLTSFLWALLAICPFIILRYRTVYIIYVSLLAAVLTILAYDAIIPYSYTAYGNYQVNGNSKSINGEHVSHWSSSLDGIQIDDIAMALVFLSPLILGIIYRRSYPEWTEDPANKDR